MKYILAFLLHHANRAINEVVTGKGQFYQIKNKLLKLYGKHQNYDVQHIPGKKCNTCGGSGIYVGYYMMSGEQWSDGCNRCGATGWYALPKWICLSRMKLARYYFHQPLKREECVRNPFTEEELGWKVTERPVVEGYIEHQITLLGRPSLLILFSLYDRQTYHESKPEILRQMLQQWYWRWSAIKRIFKFPIVRPQIHIRYLDENNNEGLPF